MHSYYRYYGSLTTPPCYESVIWTILSEPLKISFDQLHAFHQLKNYKDQALINTYRPIQKLGTRKLFRSFPPSVTVYSQYDNNSSTKQFSQYSLIIFIYFAFYYFF